MNHALQRVGSPDFLYATTAALACQGTFDTGHQIFFVPFGEVFDCRSYRLLALRRIGICALHGSLQLLRPDKLRQRPGLL